mgnify:CR=1 FL=1
MGGLTRATGRSRLKPQRNMAILFYMKTTLDIPDELYRKVKAKCALLGRKVRDVTIDLYRQWLGEDASGEETVTPERWLEEWVRLGEEALSEAPDGPTAAEIIAAERARLDRR